MYQRTSSLKNYKIITDVQVNRLAFIRPYEEKHTVTVRVITPTGESVMIAENQEVDTNTLTSVILSHENAAKELINADSQSGGAPAIQALKQLGFEEKNEG